MASAACNGASIAAEAAVLKDVRYPGGLRSLVVMVAMLPLAALTLLGMLLRDLWRDPWSFLSSRPRRTDLADLPPELAGVQPVGFDTEPGVRLTGWTFGPRPGRPLLLFLHGFPECWYSWRDQLAHLKDRYEVVALDMRGYNKSSKPAGIAAYDMDKLTSDVAAVVAALGRSRVTLVSHDWGGAIAWAVAGRYPGLVERLAVLAAPHWLLYLRNLTLEQAARSYYFLWFLLPVLPELLLLHTDARFLDALWLGAGKNEFSPRRRGACTRRDVEIYKAALQEPGAVTAALNYYRAMLLTEAGLMEPHPEVVAGLRRRLDMPVLVVWGKHDHALCLTNNIDIDQVAPRVRLHVLPDASHWIQADAPDRINAILDEWLAENPVSPSELAPAAAAAGQGNGGAAALQLRGAAAAAAVAEVAKSAGQAAAEAAAGVQEKAAEVAAAAQEKAAEVAAAAQEAAAEVAAAAKVKAAELVAAAQTETAEVAAAAKVAVETAEAGVRSRTKKRAPPQPPQQPADE
ncbi:hypothetical protein HYH02_010857 [Chlamydomonas schloesseri]|uniref:AB hydrolase-1 domain-containing protein n=1 Tax=Chlamydomonas schloesseri TaxID=2026947 RepID=A0A835W2Q8_9CHLO|nr:hypothetical protein HYH02_010857 [Chlamydomonas schloesseri]|eukprot:KAG2438402.1 hypothetical protein HYH02_010857 [Chlamydomonas schloesseri]